MKAIWGIGALLLGGGLLAGEIPPGGKTGVKRDILAEPPQERPAGRIPVPAAEATVRLLNLERVYNASLEQMIADHLAAEPRLQAYTAQVREFYRKYLDFKILRPQIVRAYAQAFSESELREINVFLATPTGRKWIEQYPLTLQKLRQIAQAEVTKHAAELKAAVKAPAPAAIEK